MRRGSAKSAAAAAAAAGVAASAARATAVAAAAAAVGGSAGAAKSTPVNLLALGIQNGSGGSGGGASGYIFRKFFLPVALYLALLWRSARKEQHRKGDDYWRSLRETEGPLAVLSLAHTALGNYVLSKTVLATSYGALFLRYVSSQAVSAPQFAVNFVNKHSASLQENVQARLEVYLSSQMDALGDKVRRQIKDPFMPVPMLSLLDDFVDSLLPDAKQMLLTKTDEIIKYRLRAQNPETDAGGQGGASGATDNAHAADAEAAAARRRRRRRKRRHRARRNEMLRKEGAATVPLQAPSAARARVLRKRNAAQRARTLGLLRRHVESTEEEDLILDELELLEQEEEYRDADVREVMWTSGGAVSVDYDDDEGDVENEHDEGGDITPDSSEDGASPAFETDAGGTRAEEASEYDSEDSDGESWAGNAQDFDGSRSWNRADVRELRRRPWYVRARAWVLYTASPYDKSFWEQTRDPGWIGITLLGLAPFGVGMLWWAMMFFMHDKRDEYQLSMFIVGYQAAKFFSQGCFSLVWGAFKFYLCSTVLSEGSCAVRGPMIGEHVDAVFFLVQMLVVWLSFFLLPYSEPCQRVHDAADKYLIEDDRRKRAALLEREVQRGGRLGKFFWWDTLSVCLVVGLGVFAWLVGGQEGWRLRTTLYWLRTLYGLLALPFVAFKIPILSPLLLGVFKGTGYDRLGRVVLQVRRFEGPARGEVPFAALGGGGNPGSHKGSGKDGTRPSAPVHGDESASSPDTARKLAMQSALSEQMSDLDAAVLEEIARIEQHSEAA